MNLFLRKIINDNRIKVGYGTAFLLLLISYLITLYSNRKLLENVALVEHSYKVAYELESLISKVKDAETGFRGYLLVKDESFLSPYYNSRKEADSSFKLLKLYTSENKLQQARLDTLNDLLNKRYYIFTWGIKTFNENGKQITQEMLKTGYEGKRLMDELRNIVSRMQFFEERRLKAYGDDLATKFRTMNVIVVVSLVLAFVMIVFAYLTYLAENAARKEADTKVQNYQEELKKRIEDLASANTELIQMRSIEKFAATGRIARTIAHEVRNPLTNINLALDQLKGEVKGNEDTDMLFGMVERNSNRINQLISDLLHSTKFLELNYARCSINTLLNQALEVVADRISLHKIKLVKKYNANECFVNVDADKIKIAFVNLIVNATEAMEKMTDRQPELVVATREAHGKCIITITDNGHGMDEESLAKLFEPYFTKKAKGNGLGLTNTQNIVLNHKGHISVESTVNSGTSFSIALDAV
jgi:signal transduction histidine kinase